MHAPDFRLPDQEGKWQSLADFKGKWVVVYFYPKDNTPGCTAEACGFQENISEFTKRGVAIIGISKDSIESHKKFAEKYQLTFPLLSDPDHKVIEAFGAWGKKKFLGREFFGTLRNTYLINPRGQKVKTYTKVNPLTHTLQVLHELEMIKKAG